MSGARAMPHEPRVANVPPQPTVSYNRTKVTLACDTCRKRRVKCTGTLPCSFCLESGQRCVYNDKNQGRRGPRPRRQPQERVIHELAPAPQQRDSCAGKTISVGDSKWKSMEPVSAVDVNLCHPAGNENSSGLVEDAASCSDAESNTFEVSSSHSILDSCTWKVNLEEILASRTSRDGFDSSIDSNLVVHLLEIFYNRCNSNVLQVIPESTFFPMIIAKTAFPGLIYAICACSVAFSVHPVARAHAREESGTEDKFTKLSRASVCNWDDTSRYMDYLRTFCVLIAYDAAKSNGQKAWLNIALSKSLVQLYRAQGHHAIDEVHALEKIEMYLETVETTHCLGHSVLQSYILSQPLARLALTDQRSRDKPAVRLVNLLKLLMRIKKHNDTCASTLPDFQPWKIESEFRQLQKEVERDRLHFSRTPFPEHEQLLANEEAGDAHAEAMCPLVCHCCEIVLNLRFLPIPESCSTTGQDVDALPQCIQFPGAPPLFLLERRKRCETSAEAIVCLSQEIVRNGGFFLHTALLGYCCMQAVFVLINQLHRRSKQQESGKLVESMEFILFLLEAVKKFYSPAGVWLDAISRAKDTSASLTHQSGTVDDAFRSYLSRFADIEEPCFVPITSKVSSNHDSTKINNFNQNLSSIATDPKATTGIQGDDDDDDDDVQTMWVDKYASHLSEDIEVEAQDEGLRETLKIPCEDRGRAELDTSTLSVSESHSDTVPTTASDNSHALPSQARLSSFVRQDQHPWNGLNLRFDAEIGAQITDIGMGAYMQLPSSGPGCIPVVDSLWQGPTLCELPSALTPEIFSELLAEEWV